ncbi:hypothetical protein WA158_000002 [Blastocystis sp. Blastoise]
MAELAGIYIAVIIIAILLIILYIITRFFYIVHQTEGIVIERLGKFHRVLNPGIHVIAPFIDNPRIFTWSKTYIGVDGSIRDESTSNYVIDKRENVFDFLRQEVYTKDTILLDVNSLMYYRIVDIKKAIYEVDDLQSAIINVAQTQLKEVFGRMTFQECMTSQDKINDYMKEAFLPRFLGWGIRVERMELLDMIPRSSTRDAMKAQMIAERERRGQFIVAEGKKAALKIRSEGTKIVKQNNGLAEQESTRKISEGASQARIEIARAESQSLNMINSVMKAYAKSQSQYMLSMRYLEFLQSISLKKNNVKLYLPYEATYLSGTISSLYNTYGYHHNNDKVKPIENDTQVESSPAVGAFDDLN